MKKNRSVLIMCVVGIAVFCVLFFLTVFAGTKALSFRDALSAVFKTSSDSQAPSSFVSAAHVILLKLRLPRAVAVTICGAALSVSGLLLQSALNNTLASPGIIGVNSGAGFFVLLAGILFPFAPWTMAAGALTGAFLAVITVYLISLKAGVSKTTLILSGVAVSSLMTAGVDILISWHPEVVSDKVAFNLGGFGNLNLLSVKIAFPLILAGIAASFVLSGGIDLFALGDEAAFGLGLNVSLYRVLSVLVAGAMAGAAVSVCGLLSFVGLIIPNVIRLGGKFSTKTGIVLCIIFGADFLLLCDLLARLLFFPYELPVGLFLSVLGAPFFIWMLISRKKHLGVGEGSSQKARRGRPKKRT